MDAATPLPDFDEVRRAIDAARDVMRTAIEARKKPDIVQIFVRVRHIHAEAAGSETYFEEAKNAESQHKAREVRLGAECLMGNGWPILKRRNSDTWGARRRAQKLERRLTRV